MRYIKTFIVIYSLFINTFVSALDLRVKNGFYLRRQADQQNRNSSFKKVGGLKKGSIVSIPDAYVVKTNGKPNLELTINQWLSKGRKEEKVKLGRFSGKKRDYFFPIKVKKATKGSKYPKDKNIFIALKSLARHGKFLEVVEDAPVVTQRDPATNKKQPTPKKMNTSIKAETAAGSQLTDQQFKQCLLRPDSQYLVEDFSHFKEEIDLVIKALGVEKAATKKSRNMNTYKKGQARNFEKNCTNGKYSFSDFENLMSDKIEKTNSKTFGLTTEVLRRLMYQESYGKACLADKPEHNGSHSVGIFQVNTKTSHVPRCNSSQLREIKNHTLDQLKNYGRHGKHLRCLENPVVNLEQALKILRKKAEILSFNKVHTKYYGKLSGFKNLFKNKDGIKMILSSYNGGQTWPLLAKHDLEEFNKQSKQKGWGVQYDPNKWSDLKVFYMRRWLNRKQKEKTVGLAASHGRKKEFTLINLKYVEGIMGFEKE